MLKKRLFIIIISLLSCFCGLARSLDFSNLSFEVLNSDIGLKSDYISGIERDDRGFMWLATIEGICRYDGKQIKYYSPFLSDGSIAYKKEIRIFKKTPDNKFLLGTALGLFLFDPIEEVFSPISPKELANSEVWTLEFDASGEKLWIGTRQGLYIYDTKSKEIEQIPISQHSPKAKSANIKTIHRDKNGNLWIGYWNGGLTRYNTNERSFSSIDIAGNNKVLSLYENPDGDIYAGTWDGQIIRIAKGEDSGEIIIRDISQQFLSIERESAPIYFIERDTATNKYWLGTNHGIYIFDDIDQPKLLKHIHSKFETPGLVNNNVGTIFYDEREQILWIGTRGGGVNLLRLSNSDISKFPLNGSLRSLFYDTETSRMWLSIRDVGLFVREGKGELKRINIGNGDINDILKLRHRNELWLGTQRNGVYIVTLKGKELPTSSQARRLNNLKSKYATRLFEDSKGRVWIGCNDGLELAEWKNEGWVCEKILPQHRIVGISEDADGSIWATTRLNGVFKIQLQDSKPIIKKYDIRTSDGLPYNNTFTIYADSQSNIWLGMSGIGLFKFDNSQDKFVQADKLLGLDLGSVSSILEQGKGELWLGTNTGVYYYNFNSSPYLLHFDQSDGLLRNICLNNALAVGDDENIYVGASNGYSVINSRAVSTSLKYNLVISDIKVNDKTIEYPQNTDNKLLQSGSKGEKKLNLNHRQNNITFQLSTLDFAAHPNCRYKYILEGKDKLWQESTENANAIQYNDLAWGKYTFRAVNLNNPDSAEINIEVDIRRPKYASWWAILLYFAIIVYVLYDMISNRIARKRLSSSLQIEIAQDDSTSETKNHSSTIAIPETKYESIDEQFLNKAIDVINKNIDNSEFEIANFTEAMGVTSSTLYRKLKSLTGMSPNEFIRHLRLQVAHKIISEKYKTITTSEVAYAVGFNIPKYFTKCFNKQFGYSPSQYRAQLIDQEEEA